MRIVTEPAVSGDFEEVRTPHGIGDQDAFQQVSSMRRDVDREDERCVADVLVEKVDVVALGVVRIVIEGEVAGQHSVEDDTTAPDVHLAAAVQAITNDKFRSGVARTSARSSHHVSMFVAILIGSTQTVLLEKVVVLELAILNVFVIAASHRIKGVGKAKVGNNNVLVVVKEKVLEFQVAVDDTIAVEVAHARYELSEQAPGLVILEVAFCQDVVEELAARGILKDDADGIGCLYHFKKADDVRVVELLEDGNLAVNFCQAASGVQFLPTNDLDGHLSIGRILPSNLHLAKFSLAKCLTEGVVAEAGSGSIDCVELTLMGKVLAFVGVVGLALLRRLLGFVHPVRAPGLRVCREGREWVKVESCKHVLERVISDRSGVARPSEEAGCRVSFLLEDEGDFGEVLVGYLN